MATNDFKPFSVAGGANVISQADYEALAALSTGFTSGVAKANEINKVLRQASFIAAALAQFVSDKGNVDVLDDGSVSGFVTKLTNAFAAQYLSRSNPFGDIKADGTAAVNLALLNLGLIVTDVGKNIISAPTKTDVLSYLGITTALDGKQPLDATLTALAALAGTANKLAYFNGTDTAALTDFTDFARGLISAPSATDARSYLQLKSAAIRDVGTGTGQIPDISSWVSGGSPTTGWRKTPDGYIEQWGLTGATTTDVFINFPIPFPTAIISLNEHDMAPSGESMSMWQFREVTLNNCVAVNLGTLTRGNPSMGSPVASGCRWFAKGV